jgi:hypothetical protein
MAEGPTIGNPSAGSGGSLPLATATRYPPDWPGRSTRDEENSGLCVNSFQTRDYVASSFAPPPVKSQICCPVLAAPRHYIDREVRQNGRAKE